MNLPLYKGNDADDVLFILAEVLHDTCFSPFILSASFMSIINWHHIMLNWIVQVTMSYIFAQ